MTRNCERCNKPICEERLEALPETRLCVDCSRVIGGDFEIEMFEENLGRSVVSKPIIIRKLRDIEPLEELE